MDPQKTSDADDAIEMAASQWKIDVDQQDPEVDLAAIVSELEKEPTESFPPVYDAVDSLITQLFSDPPPAEAQVMVQFTYHGYRIDIQQSGVVTFMEISDTADSS